MLTIEFSPTNLKVFIQFLSKIIFLLNGIHFVYIMLCLDSYFRVGILFLSFFYETLLMLQ